MVSMNLLIIHTHRTQYLLHLIVTFRNKLHPFATTGFFPLKPLTLWNFAALAWCRDKSQNRESRDRVVVTLKPIKKIYEPKKMRDKEWLWMTLVCAYGSYIGWKNMIKTSAWWVPMVGCCRTLIFFYLSLLQGGNLGWICVCGYGIWKWKGLFLWEN